MTRRLPERLIGHLAGPTLTERNAVQLSVGIGVLVALAVAVVLRLSPLVSDFPIGEGGLFWVMANELRAASFAPPDTTSFNGGAIPWMYPPLGLYLVAAVGGGLDWLRILPAIFAVATLPALWLLARSLVGSRAAVLATVAYGLADVAYVGLTAGGGVARAPGVALALLTLWAVVERRAVPAGLLGGAVLLTHPLAVAYTATGAAALWVTRGAPRSMLFAPFIALAIGAAWFVPMTIRHGVEPLVSGLGSRGGLDPIGSLVLLSRVVLYPPNLAGILGLVGAVLAWQRRRWDLLAWLAVTALGVGKSGRWTIIPLAILAGNAIDIGLERLPRRPASALAGVAVAIAIVGVLLARPEHTLTPDERATMQWVRDETPPGTTVAVIGYPASGAVVEWFPALAGRRNATTAQGTEWVADGDRWDEASATWAAGRRGACPRLISTSCGPIAPRDCRCAGGGGTGCVQQDATGTMRLPSSTRITGGSIWVERILAMIQPVMFTWAGVLSVATAVAASPQAALRPLVIGGLIALALVGIYRLVTRSWTLATIFASGFMLFTIRQPLAGLGMVTFGLWWLLVLVIRRRSGRAAPSWAVPRFIVRATAIFSIALVAVASWNFITATSSGRPEWNPPTYASDGTGGPNVYVIMLDAFPRADTLRETFGVDIGSFLDELESLGFTVSDQARANYNKTWLTLASMFNGAYIDRLLVEGSVPDEAPQQVRWASGLIEGASILDAFRVAAT